MQQQQQQRGQEERKISGRVFAYVCLAGFFVAMAAGWLMFVQGFFPLRVRVGDEADEARHQHARTKRPGMPEARFDKLVFVVFDALRADFVTSDASQVCVEERESLRPGFC